MLTIGGVMESDESNQVTSKRVMDAFIVNKFASGEARMNGMQAQLDEHKQMLFVNTESTARIEANTSELVAAFDSLKGFFVVLEWVGKAAGPIGKIIGFCLLLWGAIVAIKSGVPPK